MKRNIYLLAVPVTVMLLFLTYGAMFCYIRAIGSSPVIPAALNEQLSENIIRFHILADNDSDEDQQIKMVVKDAIVDYINPYLQDISQIGEAEAIITEQLPELERVALETLQKENAAYIASAEYGKSYFPLKVYGDIALPPGEYKSLIIKLGKAEGHNWWCIMFPELCFVDSSYTVVPDASKEKLKVLLTDEEYEAVLQTNTKTKYSFRIIEFLKSLFD